MARHEQDREVGVLVPCASSLPWWCCDLPSLWTSSSKWGQDVGTGALSALRVLCGEQAGVSRIHLSDSRTSHFLPSSPTSPNLLD